MIAGFFVGSAWKTDDTDPSNTSTTSTEETTTTETPTITSNTAPIAEKGKLNNNEAATIRLFEKSAPSVVFITTLAQQRSYFSTDITEIPRGTGSGFVWDKDGHIITNYHVIQSVVENKDKATVTFYDQSTWEAALIGIAPEKDLAVLKINAPKSLLRPIPVGNSEKLQVGQSTYAIGNPFGLDQTLTTGIVSALGREIESIGNVKIQDVIQTDAAINPGNSGGPLLNSSGELIGVNTAIYSPSGAYAGIGFSIPVDAVKWAVPDLINYGRINRPTLGIYPSRQKLNIKGVLIRGIAEGSGAEKAGLRGLLQDRYGRIIIGDIITGIDEDRIDSYSDLILTLEKYKPGDIVSVKVIREEREVAVDVMLDEGV